MQCFSNGVSTTLCFDAENLFSDYSVSATHKKKLVLINNKPTVTKMSSSHRGIFTTTITKHLPLNTGIHQSMLKNISLLTEGFTNDYAKKHLPLDRGNHQGTLQFHTNRILLLTEGFSNMPSSEALQSVSYIHLAHTHCSILPFVFSTEQLQRFHAAVFSLHCISLALLRIPFLSFSQWIITKTSRYCVLPFIDYNGTAVVPNLHFRCKQQKLCCYVSTLSHNKQSKNKLHSNLHCCAFHYSRSIFLHAVACSPLLSISSTLLCLHIYSALGVIIVHQPLHLSDRVSTAICCS